MTVQDVNMPTKATVQDIKQIRPRSENDADYWSRQKEVKRARREALEEEKMLDNLENPPMMEPPFMVKGSVNLGNIDFQEQQRIAQEKAEQERKEFQSKEREIMQKLEETQKELTETKMTQAMKEMTQQFAGIVSQLNTKIDQVAKGNGDPNSLVAYMEQLEVLAERMGYSKSGGSAAQFTDPSLTIQLEKMRIEEAARERQFQLDMKKWEYDMQRMLRKDEQEMAIRKEELENKKKRDEMLAAAPELIGRAFARGMMDSDVAGMPASAPVQSGIKGRPTGNTYEITAQKGEAGEIDCPSCHGTIAIAPTANRAVCATCNSVFNIVRAQSAKTEENLPEGLLPLEEEDGTEGLYR